MRWFRFAVLVLLITVLQASFFAESNIKPDLLLILLVFFTIHYDTTEAMISSFIIGFAADLIGRTMGPQMLSLTLIGTALAYLHQVITIKKMPYQAVAIFITVILAGSLIYFLSYLKGEHIPPNILGTLFGTALYSAIVGPFLFLPAAWWMHVKTNRFGRR